MNRISARNCFKMKEFKVKAEASLQLSKRSIFNKSMQRKPETSSPSPSSSPLAALENCGALLSRIELPTLAMFSTPLAAAAALYITFHFSISFQCFHFSIFFQCFQHLLWFQLIAPQGALYQTMDAE